MQPKPPLPVPSDSTGVEVSGADSDSETVVKRVKKESIDVLRGSRWFCEWVVRLLPGADGWNVVCFSLFYTFYGGFPT
jgi:hypothetical protein